MKILDFPKLRQTFEYDCGAKALQSVLTYYGIEVAEELLIKLAKTNKKSGTSIKNMTSVLKKYNMQFDEKNMTIKDLKEYINKKIPVIILLQAWNNHTINYSNDFHDGHWVVVIGYGRTKLIFEDPYSFERTFLNNKELDERWHSKENGDKIFNYGIAVYGKKIKYNSKKIIHMN